MRRPIFFLGATMTAAGVATAIHGIDQGYAKPVGIGLVLIFGGAVFAPSLSPAGASDFAIPPRISDSAWRQLHGTWRPCAVPNMEDVAAGFVRRYLGPQLR